jgi:hypothetical protein
MKEYRVNGGRAPPILAIGTRREWSTSRAGHFTPGTHRVGCGVGPRAGLGAFTPVGLLAPDRPALSRVTILTELSLLR